MDAASEREHLVLITIFSCIAKSLKDWDSNFYNYILRYFINTFFFFFVTNKKDINWKNYALQGWKSQDKITMFPYKPLHKYKLHWKFFKEKENWNVKQFFFFSRLISATANKSYSDIYFPFIFICCLFNSLHLSIFK